jgi:hypothetical protein
VKLAVSVLTLLTAATALAAPPRPVVYGVWTASAGKTVLHGDLSAQALPSSANTVIGSWTLRDGDGNVTMRGTWSGKKTGAGWRGAWQAKVEPAGGTFAGSWEAIPPAGFRGKTFEDLLRATATLQISGYWKLRGGGGGGAFWLKAPPS